MSKKRGKIGVGKEKSKVGLESLLIIKDNTKTNEDSVNPVIESNEPNSDLTPISKSPKAITRVKREKKSVVTIEPESALDFKSHSSLFSSAQLDELRSVVYMKKATVDRKFSIKDAVYEAFNMILKGRREPLDKYPDDFITYSPLVSMAQFEKLNSFVYTIKAKDDSKYAMKYAIYEAVSMYLKANPVNY
jgi:hypothetical protein